MTEGRRPLAELLAKAGDGDCLRSVAEAVAQVLMETDVDGLIGRRAARAHRRAHDLPPRLSRPHARHAPGQFAARVGRIVAMAGRRRTDRALRGKLKSPGRPSVALFRGAAGAPAAVLGVCCGRIVERGCGNAGRSIAAGWVPLVADGRRGAAAASVALGQAAFGTVSFVCWAGGDRAVAGAGLGRAGGCAPAGAGGVRDCARAARDAATRDGELAYRATTAHWHAERPARRPKRAKLAANTALRAYVQDRLSGAAAIPGGTAVTGPAGPWTGGRHGRRQARPGQIPCRP